MAKYVIVPDKHEKYEKKITLAITKVGGKYTDNNNKAIHIGSIICFMRWAF